MKFLSAYAVYLLLVICVWSACNANIKEIPVDDFVFRISFSTDGRLSAAITGKKVVVIDLNSKSVQSELPHDNQVLYAQFHPKTDSSKPQLISTCSGSNLYVWNIDSALTKPVARYTLTHTNEVTFIKVSPCGRYLISVTKNGFGTLWNLATGKQHNDQFKVSYSSIGLQRPADFNPGGSQYAFINGNEIEIHQTNDNTLVAKFEHSHASIVAFASTTDTPFLIAAHFNSNQLTYWNLETGDKETVAINSGDVLIDSFKVNKNQIFCVHNNTRNSRIIYMYDIQTETSYGGTIALQEEHQSIGAYTYCPDNFNVNAYADSDRLVMWNILNAEATAKQVELNDIYIQSLALSPGGAFVLSHYNKKPFGSNVDQYTIGIWQTT